ncbi:hypothetical protein L249_6748 [Ophiocordyceps polyrhachis-furcata BCC 54312]|uniref:Yeast cell wall synthesis Kre9/Knh1-like N-terminal domain-containing protein n=1 Tax=Ophiocordyceps polyrhachis-furcata BCC 54312 TaxID=1330021 RepID=A0A367LKE1_9HYPO|nr:hypothetical protein L249_6748 [Ophiocordyceps polyrhachis-furcata BCC 54312]
MRVAFSIAALVATAFAQTADFAVVTSPARDQIFEAGSILPFKWTSKTYNGPNDLVNFQLLAGRDENTLEKIATIASGTPNSQGAFDWKIGSELGKNPGHLFYGVRLELASNPQIFQYSNRFKISNNAANEVDNGAAPSYSKGTKPSYEAIATSSQMPAAYTPTNAVPVNPAVASSLSAPAASVTCADKNSTAVLAKPTGLKATPSSSNSTLLNANGNKSNGSGLPVEATGGAALLHTSLFGLCGGLLAIMFVL